MSTPRVRPEFVHPLGGSTEVFYSELADELAHAEGRCRGQTFSGGAILRIRSDDRRIWSPALHVHVEQGDGGSEIHGRFSPSSPVWTAFVGIYIALACVATASLCYGGAQMTLDETPWAFVGFPVALALAGFTYGAAFIGQGLGQEDMYEMRAFVERVAANTETARTA